MLPFISILIPIRNEEASIKQCLGSILSQDYPADRMEVLVADGLSEDSTRQILQTLQDEHSNLFVFDNPQKIVPTGLNILIGKAKGEFILRVDGHTVISPDYVRQCVQLLERSSADNVGGRMDARGENFFGEVVALVTSSPFGIGGARFHYSSKEEWVDTVYMGAWKREVFDRIGLFDEELVRDQDDEFNYRLRKHGGKILLSPKLRSYYTPRGSLSALWRQYYQYGFYKVRVLQKHPKQMRPRQFVPLAFVLALMLSLVLALFTSWGWLSLVGLVGLYALANLAASVLTAQEAGWRYFWPLPLAFATIHLGYGLGFLVGLFKFWNRWGNISSKFEAES